MNAAATMLLFSAGRGANTVRGAQSSRSPQKLRLRVSIEEIGGDVGPSLERTMDVTEHTHGPSFCEKEKLLESFQRLTYSAVYSPEIGT